MIVSKDSKFQMDTFDSFWEMDSDKKLNRKLNIKINQKLNRPRRWRLRRSDDNSSTCFLQKVEQKSGQNNIYTLLGKREFTSLVTV